MFLVFSPSYLWCALLPFLFFIFIWNKSHSLPGMSHVTSLFYAVLKTVYIYFFNNISGLLITEYWYTALIISLFHVFIMHGLQIFKPSFKFFLITFSKDDIIHLWFVLCRYSFNDPLLAATSSSTHLGQDESVFWKWLHSSVWMHSSLLVQLYSLTRYEWDWYLDLEAGDRALMVRSLLLPRMELAIVTTSHCGHAADVCRPCELCNREMQHRNWTITSLGHHTASAVSMFAFHHLRPVLSLWIYTWYRRNRFHF